MSIELFIPSDEDQEKYAQMSLCVLTPVQGYQTHARFAQCLADLVAYSWRNGLRIHKTALKMRMVVHWARNVLAEQAMAIGDPYTETPYTHFLWLDDDMVFNPDLACYLARHGDLDAVTGVYYGRQQHFPVVYHKEAGEQEEMKHMQWISVPKKLFEVDAAGFGCMLTRRDVFEAMDKPYFGFDGGGEDIYWCVKAKDKGFKIWCDGSYGCGHIGDQEIITERHHERFLDDNKATLEKGLVRVEL